MAYPNNPNTRATIISDQVLWITNEPVRIIVSNTGTSSEPRRKVTLASGLATTIPRIVPTKFPRTTVQIIRKTRSSRSTMSLGPGSTPIMIKAVMRIAMEELPGIPKARVEARAPPSTASLDDSGAITPSTIPVPNFSGFLEVCLAWP